MPVRVCASVHFSGLAGIDASLRRKIRKGTDPPVPPLYWEYRDFVLPDKPDLFIRLTFSAALLCGRSSDIRDYSCSPGPDEGLRSWRAEGLLRRLKDF